MGNENSEINFISLFKQGEIFDLCGEDVNDAEGFKGLAVTKQFIHHPHGWVGASVAEDGRRVVVVRTHHPANLVLFEHHLNSNTITAVGPAGLIKAVLGEHSKTCSEVSDVEIARLLCLCQNEVGSSAWFPKTGEGFEYSIRKMEYGWMMAVSQDSARLFNEAISGTKALASRQRSADLSALEQAPSMKARPATPRPKRKGVSVSADLRELRSGQVSPSELVFGRR